MENRENPHRPKRKQLVPPPEERIRGAGSSTYTDHNGQKAIHVYWGSAPGPGLPILPPLLAFQFYVTFDGVTADSAADLPEQLLAALWRPLMHRYPLRLDINFLPGADAEMCMEHYRGERASRRAAGVPLQLFDPFYGSGLTHFSLLTIVDKADWQSKGSTIVYFEPDDDPQRVWMEPNLQWGEWRRTPKTMDTEEYMGESLDFTAGSQDAKDDLYDARLEQGRSDWD